MADDDERGALPRPRQVTLGVGVVGGASVAMLLVVGTLLAQFQSIDFREKIAGVVEREGAAGLTLDLDQVLLVTRIGLMVTGATATALVVLAVFAARGDRGARVGISVLAVPMLVCGIFVSPFLAAFVVAATVVLWTTPASDWYAGRRPRPVSEPPPLTADDLRRLPPPASPSAPSGPTLSSAPTATLATPAVAGPSRRGSRPGRLIAATVVSGVVSLLVAGVFAASAVVVNTGQGRREIERVLTENPSVNRQDLGMDQLVQGITILAAVLALWALVAVVLSVLALVGQGWARVALVVSAVVTVLASVVGLLALPALLVLTALALLVVVLLLHPDVSAWYAGRPRPLRPGEGPRA